MKKSTLLLIACATVLIFSCKKSKDTDPTDETPTTQNLSFHFNPVVGSKPLNYSSVYTTTSGQKYTLSALRYYVSNIRLVKADGSEFPIVGKYLLVTPAIGEYSLGGVPLGDYKGIKFALGIDSVTNHKDPTVYPITNPLAIQSPAMHWSWNAGYIFTMIEGSCDTTVNNTDTLKFGQYSHGMFYHMGMDMLYRTVNLTSAFTVNSTGSKVINIQTDLNKFFINIDVKTENATHTMGSMPLATKAATNFSTVFSIIP